MDAKKPIRLVRLGDDAAQLAAGGPLERVAVISAVPGTQAGSWLLRVARGAALGSLTTGTTYGPYAEADVSDRIGDLVAVLIGEGYTEATDIDLILALSSGKAAVRARAALRLGWRRQRAAVGALLRAAQTARGDLCSIVDALGWIGDPMAIDLARSVAERKNLSRRRSGVEALRALGAADEVARICERELERLPPAVAAALAQVDERKPGEGAVTAIVAGIADAKKIGLCADVLYERDTLLGRRVAQRLLRGEQAVKPHVWRYTKSVLKRAMLRHDTSTVAALAREIERASLHSSGEMALVKSGLDGKTRSVLVFSKKTQRYVLRAVWRYLRDLARYRPAEYPRAATAILLHYADADLVEPSGEFGAQARAFLFHRILHQQSQRFEVSWYTLRHRTLGAKSVRAPEGVREEAFPALWDAHPRWFLRLLQRARWLDVIDFAEAGIERHPEVLRDASVAELLSLAARDSARTQALALGELGRRWQAAPDLALLDEVMQSTAEVVWPLVRAWLETSASQWALDEERLLRYALVAPAALRAAVAELAVAPLVAAPPELRRALAPRVLEILRGPEPEPGYHAPLARLAVAALAGDIDRLLATTMLLALIRDGSNAARELAAALLAPRSDALELLGLEGVVMLAENEVAAVRRAALGLLAAAPTGAEPTTSLLFALAESRWDDTRERAFALLRALPLAALGLDGIVGLCDATHPQVQAFGRELAIRHFDELSAEELLFRLSEHPAQHMRKYALGLIRDHLRPGTVPLMRIEKYLRACLFDVRPDRELKSDLLDFLLARGLADPGQADVVAALLGDVVRSATVWDFQRVSGALARIQVAHPQTDSPLRVIVQEAP